jgi:NAD(P)-dependent dehydrogenase (short-subunit alcohol dehydrogenase family)
VGDEASVRAAVEATVGELGPPSVVCNVAGIARFGNSVDVPLAEWEQVLRVNLTGVFIVCQATLPHLLEHGGNIVNVASTSGLMGQKYAAAYCASKGGVVLLTKALATEYVGRGVRVNAVAPGGIDTPITQNFAMPEGARMKDFERIMSPLGFAQPEDVAGLVAYLASDDAWYVTGSINTIDGGITA